MTLPVGGMLNSNIYRYNRFLPSDFSLLECSGHTFETRGGNLNASTVLHVPYRNDAGKLASAFKEAISFISNQGAVTSAVFFNKKRKWQSNYLRLRIFL